LLLENVENRGYEKGYCDGLAIGRSQGRKEGIEIVQRRIVQALQDEGLAQAVIAKVIGLPVTPIESLPGTVRSSNGQDNKPDLDELPGGSIIMHSKTY